MAVKKAMVSAEGSKVPVQNHFAGVSKMVKLGSGAKRELEDYKLTRYAGYLIAQNGNPRKEEIAFALQMHYRSPLDFSDEHVQNNRGVRDILGQRGINPKNCRLRKT